MRTGLATLGTALVLLAGCGGGESSKSPAKPTGPVPTVKAYLAAVFEADGAAACELLNKDLRQEAAKTVRTLRMRVKPTCEAFIAETFKPQKEGTSILFEGELISKDDVDGLELNVESKDATTATVGTGPDGTQKFELDKAGGRWKLSDVAGNPITL